MAIPVDARRNHSDASVPGVPEPRVDTCSAPPSKCSRVLVVEDDPSVRVLYETVLIDRGHEVTLCESAEEALDIYSNQFYPIVLLDWKMLGMDGLTLCGKMRELPHGRMSVILMITSNDEPEHLEQVLKSGVDDYITKPVSLKILSIRLTIAERRAGINAKRRDAEERVRMTGLEMEYQRDWLEVTLSSIGDGIISTDTEGHINFINTEGERLTGWTEEEALGLPIEEVFPIVHEKTGKPVENSLRKTLRTGSPLIQPWRTVLVARDGTQLPIDDSGTLIRDHNGRLHGAVLVFRDVHERVLQERAIESSMRGVEKVKREWESTVDALSEVVCLLDESGKVIRANMAVERWNLMRVEEVRDIDFHELFHAGCNGVGCYLKHLWTRVKPNLKEGRAQELEVCDDVLGRHLRIRFRPIESNYGNHAESRTVSFAVVTVEDITERKVLEAKLEVAREHELQTGSRIQQALLFDGLPDSMEGLELFAKTVPSKHIDGDFYAFFQHSEHCLDVVVGDVMGKGIPAALIGAATKNHFLAAISHLIQASPDSSLPQPKDIVHYVHKAMSQRLIDLENFLTLCYARFDLDKRTMTFVDCGHTRTIHYCRDKDECCSHQGENMPMGFSDREILHQSEVSFGAGDLLLFYSDGVIEAKIDPSHDSGSAVLEIFGEERLSRFLGKHNDLGPAELTDRIRREVVEFSGSERFSDDLTVIAVKIQDVEADPMSIAHKELKITSNLSHLALVRAFLRDTLDKVKPAPLDEEKIGQLELALVECVTNTIKHAYEGREDQLIRIEIDVREDRVQVCIHHWGEDFDTEDVPDPVFDGISSGGFGLYIIDHFVDEVVRTRDRNEKSCISLTKFRA